MTSPVALDPFSERIHNYLVSHGRLWKKLPTMGGQRLDLEVLYKSVCDLGGAHVVNKNKKWGSIGRILGVPKSCTNPSFILKRAYLYYLYDYEVTQHPEYDRSIPIDEAQGAIRQKENVDARIRFIQQRAMEKKEQQEKKAQEDEVARLIAKEAAAAAQSAAAYAQQQAKARSRPLHVPESYELAAKRKILLSLESGVNSEVDWALRTLSVMTFNNDELHFDNEAGLFEVLLRIATKDLKSQLPHITKRISVLCGSWESVDNNEGNRSLYEIAEFVSKAPKYLPSPWLEERDIHRAAAACTIIRNLSLHERNAGFLAQSWQRILELLLVSMYLPASAASSLVEATTNGLGHVFQRLSNDTSSHGQAHASHSRNSLPVSTKEFDEGSTFMSGAIDAVSRMLESTSLTRASPQHLSCTVDDVKCFRAAILYAYACILRLASKDAAKSAWTQEWSAAAISGIMEESYSPSSLNTVQTKLVRTRALSCLQALWLLTLHHPEVSSTIAQSEELVRAVTSRVFYYAEKEPGSVTVPSAVLINLLKSKTARSIVLEYEDSFLDLLQSRESAESASVILYHAGLCE